MKFKIFAEEELRAYLLHTAHAVLSGIEQEKDDYLLNVNEDDYVRFKVAEMSVDEVIIHGEHIHASSAERMIPAISFPSHFFVRPGESYKKDVIGMLDWADKIASEGKERHKLYLVYALHMFRQSLMNNYVGEHMLRVSSEEEKFLRNFAPFISGNNIREFMETFDSAYFHIDRNANSKILFTQLCFQTMRYIHQA